MKFSEKYSLSKTWLGKIKVIALYHHIKVYKNPNWKLANTARYFNVSISLVSENIMLGSNLDKIEKCKTRTAALHAIRKK
jgi:hypothetical protein